MNTISENSSTIDKIVEFSFNGQNTPKWALNNILERRGLKLDLTEKPDMISAVTLASDGKKSAYYIQPYYNMAAEGYLPLMMGSKLSWPYYNLPSKEIIDQYERFYVCYYCILTESVWIFNLADFTQGEDDYYRITGMGFRAIYRHNKYSDVWEPLIIA